MKRRDFIKQAGLATAGTFLVPYLLPSGRLFAATGNRKANHVVFCLFAGGVRNIETIQMNDGNLMPYTLAGSKAISADILPGMTFKPPAPTGQPLQTLGTLFSEFRYALGPTGHYNGHTAAITGVYTHTNLSLKDHPPVPTVFEYYRKHSSPAKAALNAWWVSNSLGPFPALNYSIDPNYGPLYGANYIQPDSLIKHAYNVLYKPQVFSAGQKTSANEIRQFLDNNFSNQNTSTNAGVSNPLTDADNIESFILKSIAEAGTGAYKDPWGVGSLSVDMFNIFFAEKIIQQYTPELLVVNMQDVDIAHYNFTNYCDNMRRADYSLSHLWNFIQSTPGMANDTILIAAPEHGRNLTSNSFVDNYGRHALDHTGDDMSREIFCLVIGPPSVVKQNQVITAVEGQSIDIVPTIANILGFDTDIPGNYKSNMGQLLSPAFY